MNEKGYGIGYYIDGTPFITHDGDFYATIPKGVKADEALSSIMRDEPIGEYKNNALYKHRDIAPKKAWPLFDLRRIRIEETGEDIPVLELGKYIINDNKALTDEEITSLFEKLGFAKEAVRKAQKSIENNVSTILKCITECEEAENAKRLEDGTRVVYNKNGEVVLRLAAALEKETASDISTSGGIKTCNNKLKRMGFSLKEINAARNKCRHDACLIADILLGAQKEHDNNYKEINVPSDPYAKFVKYVLKEVGPNDTRYIFLSSVPESLTSPISAFDTYDNLITSAVKANVLTEEEAGRIIILLIEKMWEVNQNIYPDDPGIYDKTKATLFYGYCQKWYPRENQLKLILIEMEYLLGFSKKSCDYFIAAMKKIRKARDHTFNLIRKQTEPLVKELEAAIAKGEKFLRSEQNLDEKEYEKNGKVNIATLSDWIFIHYILTHLDDIYRYKLLFSDWSIFNSLCELPCENNIRILAILSTIFTMKASYITMSSNGNSERLEVSNKAFTFCNESDQSYISQFEKYMSSKLKPEYNMSSKLKPEYKWIELYSSGKRLTPDCLIDVYRALYEARDKIKNNDCIDTNCVTIQLCLGILGIDNKLSIGVARHYSKALQLTKSNSSNKRISVSRYIGQNGESTTEPEKEPDGQQRSRIINYKSLVRDFKNSIFDYTGEKLTIKKPMFFEDAISHYREAQQLGLPVPSIDIYLSAVDAYNISKGMISALYTIRYRYELLLYKLENPENKIAADINKQTVIDAYDEYEKNILQDTNNQRRNKIIELISNVEKEVVYQEVALDELYKDKEISLDNLSKKFELFNHKV